MLDFGGFLGVIKLAMVGGFGLALAFMILIALPRSPLRNFSLQFMLWSFTAICTFFVVSPVDLLPFLPFDDIFTLGGGVTAAAGAVLQKLSQRRADREAERLEKMYMQARLAYAAVHAKTELRPPMREENSMNRLNHDEKRAEALRWLLRLGLEALKKRLARRMEQWMRRASLRRDAKTSETVTLHTEDYREIP